MKHHLKCENSRGKTRHRHSARRLPGWLTGVAAAGAFVGLLVAERRRPLRRRTQPKLTRDARNLAMAALSGTAVHWLSRPVLDPLSHMVERRRWGLCQRLPLPRPLRVAITIMLLDYTLYLWHVATHRVPFLWRFHRVHHVDLDMDASTALRFHFGELTLATGFHAGQVVLLGAGPRELSLWQSLLMLSVLFHHSNVRLPKAIERRLARLIITPRLHGIHHSMIRDQTDSNWSSGLSIWDRLHGTLRLDVPQDTITIGVPAYRQPEQVRLARLLEMPLHTTDGDWPLPDDRSPTVAAR